MAAVLLIIGVALVVTAAAFLSLPAVLAVLGLSCISVAIDLTRRDRT